MKKRITIIILLITTLSLSIFTQGTFAWFSDIVYNQKVFESGSIKYIYSGTLISLNEGEVIVPGQPLISSGNLLLTNQSTIDTNLRVLIYCSYVDQITHETVQGPYGQSGSSFNDFLDIQMVPEWIYDSLDNCWHYKYDSTNLYNIPASTDESPFPIIDTIEFNGNMVDMSLSGTTFKLTLVFQAKQSHLVTWSTIGTQDIENLVAS